MPGSEPAGSEPVLVGQVADFPLNACKIVDVAGREVGIIRTEQGIFAIANRCPHMGGGICYGTVTGVMTASSAEHISYHEEQKAVRCPWHGWEFLLSTGAAVGGITNRKLRRFSLHVTGDNVYVSTRAPQKDDDSTLVAHHAR